MRRALALVLLAACAGATTSTTTEPVEVIVGTIVLRQHTVRPTVVFDAQGNQQPEAPCSGRDGYDDLTAGAQVVVSDAEGTIIGSDHLEPGVRVEIEDSVFCQFTFSVKVSPGENFYTVEVSDRGELTYSRADLETANWTVDLELG